jgi:hypothetical protein
MYLTKPNLYFTPELQDKIVRYKRYRVNSFVSVPLNCGKLCNYCSKGST